MTENKGQAQARSLSGTLDAAGTSALGLGGGTSMVKAHLRAWDTVPSSPLPRGGPGGRWQAVGGPRAGHGPLQPLVSSSTDILKSSRPRPVSGTKPDPTQQWEPSPTASWGAAETGFRPLSSEHVRSCEDQAPLASLLPCRAAGPHCGHQAQALADRSEDQVPGDQTHHLPTCILGNTLP